MCTQAGGEYNMHDPRRAVESSEDGTKSDGEEKEV